MIEKAGHRFSTATKVAATLVTTAAAMSAGVIGYLTWQDQQARITITVDEVVPGRGNLVYAIELQDVIERVTMLEEAF